jgi:hypothetical protein
MPLKVAEVSRALAGKFDFEQEREGHGEDHIWYSLVRPGCPEVITKVSKGRRELTRGVETRIAKQLRVPTRTYFQQMVKCTRSRDEYYAFLESISDTAS